MRVESGEDGEAAARPAVKSQREKRLWWRGQTAEELLVRAHRRHVADTCGSEPPALSADERNFAKIAPASFLPRMLYCGQLHPLSLELRLTNHSTPPSPGPPPRAPGSAIKRN